MNKNFSIENFINPNIINYENLFQKNIKDNLIVEKKNNFWETDIIDFCRIFLSDKNFTNIFDIGSNIGGTAIGLAQNLKITKNIYCFEPLLYRELLFNILKNNISNCAVIPVAIHGDEYDIKTFYYNDQSIYKSNSSLIKNEKILNVETNVNCFSLKYFCINYNVFPDLVKIDTEGKDSEIIINSFDIFLKNKSIIFYEYNADQNLIDHFYKNNYSLFNINTLEKITDINNSHISRNIIAIHNDDKELIYKLNNYKLTKIVEKNFNSVYFEIDLQEKNILNVNLLINDQQIDKLSLFSIDFKFNDTIIKTFTLNEVRNEIIYHKSFLFLINSNGNFKIEIKNSSQKIFSKIIINSLTFL